MYPHWAQEEEEEPGPDRDRRSINANEVEHLRTKRGEGRKEGTSVQAGWRFEKER